MITTVYYSGSYNRTGIRLFPLIICLLYCKKNNYIFSISDNLYKYFEKTNTFNIINILDGTLYNILKNTQLLNTPDELNKESVRILSSVDCFSICELEYKNSRYLDEALSIESKNKSDILEGNRKLDIIIHIRRDDIGKLSSRFVSNSYYIDVLIPKLYKKYPGSNIKIISTKKTSTTWEDFKELESNNNNISLDLADNSYEYLIRHIEIMIHCDVLVIAPSLFSYVPAIFSMAKVFYLENAVNRPEPIMSKWEQI